MNVLFVDIPVYNQVLPEPYRTTHRLRRLASDRIAETIVGTPLPSGKLAFCRGLLLLATAVEAEGVKTRYLHFPVVAYNDLTKAFAAADILCLYAMTPTVDTCLDLARKAKSVNSDILVALGGPHARSQCHTLLQNDCVDFVCRANISPKLLATALLDPSQRSHCPGIAFKQTFQASQITYNDAEAPTSSSYDEAIDYSLLPYDLHTYYLNISASQGCSYSCRFCSQGNQPLRLRSLETLFSEIQYLDSHLPPKSWIHFFDSIFTLPADRAETISSWLADNIHNLIYSCDTKANHISADLSRKMHNAGFRFISIGFETAYDPALDTNGRHHNFAEACATASLLQRTMEQCVIKANWILGLPGTTYEAALADIEQMKALLTDGVVDIIGPKFFVPYPETTYYSQPELHGLTISNSNWDEYDRFRIPPVSTPVGFSTDDLAKCQLMAEKAVLDCYYHRLGTSDTGLLTVQDHPARYNGDLYSRVVF